MPDPPDPGARSAASLAVVHLVRRANGIEPLDAFLTSYEHHDPGREHELVLLYKGFGSASELEPFRQRARSLVSRELHVPDAGADLTAYFAAARELPHDRLCFLNSFSTLRSAGWLRRLADVLDRPQVGIVGATGSWASMSSLALWNLRLPSGYGRALRRHVELRAALPSRPEAPAASIWRGRLAAVRDMPRKVAAYPGFPIPHVRTNGFMAERRRLLGVRTGSLASRERSHRLESGRRNLTSELTDRDLAALLVGCEGPALAAPQWPEAELFWQGRQGNLLIADNQTRAYEDASPAGRDALARIAWGDRARAAS